jgi:hypothetical protein
MFMTRRQRAVQTAARRAYDNRNQPVPLRPANDRDALDQEALRRAAARKPGWWAR